MPIQLKVSNSLDSLSKELAQQISETDSVFRPIYIVTQTEGMNSWLKLKLAEHLGISANIKFLRPNDFIQEVFDLLGGKDRTAISHQDFTWLLFEALKEQSFVHRFPEIAQYYGDKMPDKDIKRLALSEKIADLFDQYQIYRPEMIQKWNEGGKDIHWQQVLWKNVKEKSGTGFPDKDLIEKEILAHLQIPEKLGALKKQIPVVYFFGLSLITKYHYQILQALSKDMELQFLMQNPAPYDYWYEDKSPKLIEFLKRKGYYPESEKSIANPLLVGWGRLIRDTFMLLFENEEALNNYVEIGVREPKKDSLLHHIQHTIFNNQKEVFQFSEKQFKDDSITIHSCFSPIREVEALYNYLVYLVEQKKEDLSVRDIVVMVTDIDLYASYIKAVFDNAPYAFRYTIADESYAVSDSLSNTLKSLLSLTEKEFTSEKVVGLLDYSALREKFKIKDIVKIREWVEAANIHFGFEGNVENDTDYVSWEYGLKRMMYGLCMSGGAEYGTDAESFYPLDIVEGFDMFSVVRFVHFVEQLMELIKERKGKRNLSDWVGYVEKVIRTFIAEGEEEDTGEKHPLIKKLEYYHVLQEVIKEEVSYEVFSYNFLPTLSQTKRSEYFGRGGITFCSLVPMRSIPFKVVALLGMDFDKFPRIDNRVSFDLMQQKRMPGDRNLKDNDKHLFLETLLSAGDYFYLSYIGQSLKDNTALPPSALIDELLDFLERNAETQEDMVEKQLVTKQPLHGFSKQYNTGNPRLYSYLLKGNSQKIDFLIEKETKDFDFEEIDLHQIVRFLENPFKGYFNRVLNIYFEEENNSLEETEVFQLDHLEKWYLKNDLLKISDAEVADYRIKETKLGRLPLKNMGKVVIQETQEDIEKVQSLYHQLTEGWEEEKIAIDLEIDTVRITGLISGIFNQKLVRYSFSKGENKYLLRSYLHYLFLAASGKGRDLYFISYKNGEIKKGKKIEKEEAQKRLTEIVKIFRQGHREILPFHCNFKMKAKDIDSLDYPTFLRKMQYYFNDFNYPCTEPYQVKPYRNGFFNEKRFEQYKKIANILLVPVDDFFWIENRDGGRRKNGFL